MNSMKKIGEGLYYDVYELSSTRVLKVEKPYWRKQLTYLKWGMLRYFFRNLIHPGIFKSSLEDSKRLPVIGGELFGNTIFHDHFTCEQDKVQTIEAYFRTHSDEEKKVIIEKYIQLTYMLWERGFSDVVFNYLRNNGVTEDGRVILCDFNEVTFSKEETIRAVQRKPWLKPWMLRLLFGSFERHVKKRLHAAFTIAHIEKYWNTHGN